MEYIKKEIESPFIDPVYSNLGLDENGRKYMEIDPSEFQDQDTSWQIFQRFFTTFVIYYDVNYKDYLNNKVTVNKNSLKMLKAISRFYNETEEKKNDLLISCPQIYWDMTDNNIPFEKGLSNCITDLFEKRKTKKMTSLVLSFNLSDWFLCSTGESWQSCLSLDKPESTEMYWACIPSLFSDKNRGLLYVTNHDQIEFFGLKKDKMLNRSWVMLSNKDDLYIVRNYPNTAYKNLNLSNLLDFKNKIIHMDIERDRDNDSYIGKHNIKPLYTSFSKNKYVLFPYLDNHRFKSGEKKLIPTAASSGNSNLQRTKDGYWITLNNGVGWTRYGNFFNLIKNNVSIRTYYYRYKCSKCFDGIPSQRKKDIKNQAYCSTCYSLLFTCLCCEKKTDKLYNDNKYCSICSANKKKEENKD